MSAAQVLAAVAVVREGPVHAPASVLTRVRIARAVRCVQRRVVWRGRMLLLRPESRIGPFWKSLRWHSGIVDARQIIITSCCDKPY